MTTKLDQTSLVNVDLEKDHGVTIHEKLKFMKHINNNRVNKANLMEEVIRRSFRHPDCKMFSRLYISLVRLYVEYVVSVWNPHLKKDFKKMESVPRRTTKEMFYQSSAMHKDSGYSNCPH